MKPLLKNDLLWAGPLGIAGLIIYLLTFLQPHVRRRSGSSPTIMGARWRWRLAASPPPCWGWSRAWSRTSPERGSTCCTGRCRSNGCSGPGMGWGWPSSPPGWCWGRRCTWPARTCSAPTPRCWTTAGCGSSSAQGLPALLFYALGVWVASFPRTLIGGTLLLAVIGSPRGWWLLAGVLVTRAAVSAGIVVASLALTPLLLWAALAAMRTRPGPRPTLDGGAVAAGGAGRGAGGHCRRQHGRDAGGDRRHRPACSACTRWRASTTGKVVLYR